MAMTLEPFLQSPIRDTIPWHRSQRINQRRIEASIGIYKGALEGKVHFYLSPVVGGERQIVFSGRPAVVLGESIADKLGASNFLWLERVFVDNKADTQVYALVIVQDGSVIVDQVAPLMEILTLDFIKIFPPSEDSGIYAHNLRDDEIEALCREIKRQFHEVQRLPESVLDSMDLTAETVARTFELEEALVHNGLISAPQRTYFALAGLAVAAVAAYFFIYADDETSTAIDIAQISLEQSVNDLVEITLPEAEGVPLLLGTAEIFRTFLTLYDVNWWYLDRLQWNVANQNRLDVAFLVNGRVAHRVARAVRQLGHNTLEESNSTLSEELVKNRISMAVDVPVSKVSRLPIAFRSNDPEVQAVLFGLEDLSLLEWLYQILTYYQLDSSSVNIGGTTSGSGLVIDGEPISFFPVSINWKDVDLDTLLSFTQVLSTKNCALEEIDMQVSALGLMTGTLTFIVYETVTQSEEVGL